MRRWLRRRPTVAVLTMVRDEAVWLPRWIRHYGEQVGTEHLTVFDDNTADGSTDGLPCRVERMAPDWVEGRSFDSARTRLMNRTARRLLEEYDVVVYTDVDEFLVPDPTEHRSLRDFLRARAEVPVIAPVGLNVIQHAGVEGDLRPDLPVTEQRAFAKFAGGMCKPSIKRVPARWRSAGHGIMVPYTIDTELFLLHTKFADRADLEVAAARRHARFLTENAGHTSTWVRPPDALLRRLKRRVDSVDPATVPEFDPHQVDLSACLTTERGFHRSLGGAWAGLAREPLVRIPARLRGTV